MAIDLTTADRVKRRWRTTETTLDSLIGEIIDEVSQTFERFMQRHTLSAARVEIVELPRFKKVVTFRGAPVSSVTEIKVHNTGDFTSVDALDSTLYTVDLAAGYARLRILTTWRPAYVEVNYTGGMAADTATFIASYPEISAAADRECIERLRKSRNPTGTPVLRAKGGKPEQRPDNDWGLMASTRLVLTAYRKGIV